MRTKVLVISCEHAVNTIPECYQYLFTPFTHLLNSHRGIDFGALEIALHFKEVFSCDFTQAQASRLLIDCNRSLHNKCFSEITQKLSKEEKQEIINKFYLPFREKVIKDISKHIDNGYQVIHCSIHSFTPILHEIVRTTEIGFLYDPQREKEKIFSQKWKEEIYKITKEYRIRMNYPYKGNSDGFTTFLRKKFSAENYIGIEVETNHSITQQANLLSVLKNILSQSLLNTERLL